MPASSTLITRHRSLLMKTSVLGIQWVSPVLINRFATGAFCPAGYNGELTLHMRLNPMLSYMHGRFKPLFPGFSMGRCLDQYLGTFTFPGLKHHIRHRTGPCARATAP